MNDIRGSQAFKEGAYLGLQITERCAQSSPSVLVSLWPIVYREDLIRPPPSICSGVVAVEGQGVDTKLQQQLHQELLSDSSFFFVSCFSREEA